jgi:hypothetical protein
VYREISIKLNSDGTSKITCTVINPDSTFYNSTTKSPFFLITDSTWNITQTDDSGKFYKYTATKNFKSCKELKKIQLYNKSNWSNVKHTFSLKKQFKWFYTYYSYEEKFYPVNPFQIPVSKYLSKNDLSIWSNENVTFNTNKDSLYKKKVQDTIDKKINLWLQECFVDEFLKSTDSILKTNKLLKANINSSTLKDTIIKTIEFPNSDAGFENIVHFISQYYNNKQIETLLLPKVSSIIEEIDSTKVLSKYFYDDYTYKITLPGKLQTTNAHRTIKDTLIWEVDAYKFFFNEYELSAVSKDSNPWVYILTIFILIVAPIIVWAKKN